MLAFCFASLPLEENLFIWVEQSEKSNVAALIAAVVVCVGVPKNCRAMTVIAAPVAAAKLKDKVEFTSIGLPKIAVK